MRDARGRERGGRAAFAASTQKYLLGTDGDAFPDKTKWSAFIGPIFEVTKNSDGDIPQFGQLAQPSMQPMTEHFGNLCKRMSAATGINVGQFGIVSDNPSSADAIYSENSPLILKCKSFIKEAKAALSRVVAARSATLTRQQASSSTSTGTVTARSCLGSRATRTRSWPRGFGRGSCSSEWRSRKSEQGSASPARRPLGS